MPPHGDLDERWRSIRAAALALGEWYAFATAALDTLRDEARPGDDASIVRIWPEHFDAAIDMGEPAAGRRATYGGSPGDGHHAEPYLYASPWAGRIDGFFGDPTFKGASLLYSAAGGRGRPDGGGARVPARGPRADPAACLRPRGSRSTRVSSRSTESPPWWRRAGRSASPAPSEGYGALDNRCPHQGGPLGDGQIENGYLICPWHALRVQPVHRQAAARASATRPPRMRSSSATTACTSSCPCAEERVSLMDQMVDVLCDWGLDTVFGMVGHSNLGLADALRKAEEDGRLTYIGIRHEGAAAFAASGYAKLTGRPAACFSIAGPGATNLLTGLWDAKVDRVPILALTGQVQTQVVGPGAFQELPLAQAFDAVAEWSQTVLSPDNATELAALAMKHAVVNRDVAHLIFPDEVQELRASTSRRARPRAGRVGGDRDRAARRPSWTGRSRCSSAARAAGDHRRQRRAAVPRRGAGARRADRRAGDHHLQGQGLVPDDHPLGVRRAGPVGHPRRRPP